MENKFAQRNFGFISPESITDKIYYRSNEVVSPKFTRKRNDIQTYFGRKTEGKGEQNQTITFISPKKYLEHPKGWTDSFSSKSSIKSLNPSENFQNILPNDQSTISTSSITSFIEQKLPTSRSFESAQEIIARVKANKEAVEFKGKSQNLEKKINELNQKIKNLKEENQYLFSKIEDFNGIISQKNVIINQFSTMLKQKDQSISYFHNEIDFLKKKNQQLESVITSLNKSLEESFKCSCNNLTAETQDGEREKQYWELEIKRYKSQIQQLKSKITYSEIQTNMFQKLRYDLDHQLNRNEILKNQNKKLIVKIEQLTEKTKQVSCKTDRRNPHFGRQRYNGKDSQVLLELSPEK